MIGTNRGFITLIDIIVYKTMLGEYNLSEIRIPYKQEIRRHLERLRERPRRVYYVQHTSYQGGGAGGPLTNKDSRRAA